MGRCLFGGLERARTIFLKNNFNLVMKIFGIFIEFFKLPGFGLGEILAGFGVGIGLATPVEIIPPDDLEACLIARLFQVCK